MDNENIKLELAKNRIAWIEENDRILAFEVYIADGKAGCMPVDVTGFSAIELKIWLG